jgi:hypothetical protein
VVLAPFLAGAFAAALTGAFFAVAFLTFLAGAFLAFAAVAFGTGTFLHGAAGAGCFVMAFFAARLFFITAGAAFFPGAESLRFGCVDSEVAFDGRCLLFAEPFLAFRDNARRASFVRATAASASRNNS